jgi:hypothetical protein
LAADLVVCPLELLIRLYWVLACCGFFSQRVV